MAKNRLARNWRPRNEITAAQVRDALEYDCSTGDFRWKWRRDICIQANSRLVGRTAGKTNKNGYVYIGLYGNIIQAHIIAWIYMTGSWPNHMIDHRNNSRNDNRWDNLRPATRAQNMWNSRKKRTNKCGLKGASFCKQQKKWKAQIYHNGKSEFIGMYDTPQQAHEAYCSRAKELRGEFFNAGH